MYRYYLNVEIKGKCDNGYDIKDNIVKMEVLSDNYIQLEQDINKAINGVVSWEIVKIVELQDLKNIQIK